MKILEELAELSRKADKIIHSSIDFNIDFIKTIKEKAETIMACKTLEELKEISKTTEPKKDQMKFDVPLEQNKVHLHSNKSSLASTSEFSDQNNVGNTSDLEKQDVIYFKQISNPSPVSNKEEFLSRNCDSEVDDLENETNKRDEFENMSSDSETYQKKFNAQNSKESNSRNSVKVNNFYSTSVETSSESTTSKDINGIYTSTKSVFEKRRNINVMEKIEENNEEIISQKFVTVSTMIKTSFVKSSTEKVEETNADESDSYTKNACSSNNNFKEQHHDSSARVLQMDVEKTYDKNKANESFIHKNLSFPCKEPKCITIKEDSGQLKTSPGNNMSNQLDICNLVAENGIFNSKNSIVIDSESELPPTCPNSGQFKTSSRNNTSNQLDTCNLISENEILNSRNPIVIDSESELPPTCPNSPQKRTPELQKIDDATIETLEKMFFSPRKECEVKTDFVSEADGHMNPMNVKGAEINVKKKKFSKKNFILATNIQGVSAIPVLAEKKEPKSENLRIEPRMMRKLKVNKSPLSKNTRGYNLRSTRNNCSLRTNVKSGNKNLSLKEKVEEKKKLREQKMKLTRERRENLERIRRERLRMSVEKRTKRFQKHKEILDRKIIEIKNRAKRRKLSNQFTNSSEVSPDVLSGPQSSEEGLQRTFLVENLKDISPIEPIENTKDKKISMRQSVVLLDVAHLMPSGKIQNCLNLSQNKEIEQLCNRTPNFIVSYQVGKIKSSIIPKENSPSAPIKKHMRSTRKISASPAGGVARKRRLSNSCLNTVKHEICKKILKEKDTQSFKSPFEETRKRFLNPNSATSEQVDDLVTPKFALDKATKANYIRSIAAKFQNDPKHSMEPHVVLENQPKPKIEEAIRSENKKTNKENAAKPVTLSANTINNDAKRSVLSPVVVLKDISNKISYHSKLTDDKSKTEKVPVLENGIHNKRKLLTLKPGAVSKDIIKSKSCVLIAGKKLETISKKAAANNKRKAQGNLDNTKAKKRQLVIIKAAPAKQSKRSLTPQEILSDDITSYEISDISDNSFNIVEPKPKKIPSWASSIHLKKAISKQHYQQQDPDAIFGNFSSQKPINLADIFTIDKPRYNIRTSSAKWSSNESPI